MLMRAAAAAAAAADAASVKPSLCWHDSFATGVLARNFDERRTPDDLKFMERSLFHGSWLTATLTPEAQTQSGARASRYDWPKQAVHHQVTSSWICIVAHDAE